MMNLPFINYRIIKSMIDAGHPNQRRHNRTNKQIIIIISVYIILTISNRFSTKSNESDENLMIKIKSKTNIQMSTIINQISKEKLQGNWKLTSEAAQPILEHRNGKFQMLVVRYTQTEGEKVTLDIYLKNGEYADDGIISFRVTELSTDWKIQLQENKITARLFENQTQIKSSFMEQKIFLTVNQGEFKFTNVQIIYEIKDKTLQKYLILYSGNEQIVFDLKQQGYNMSGTILFALILFVIAYSQFSACLETIRKFIEGQDSPGNYSFCTLVIAMMWDAALCLAAFIEAFKNEENIVLFIVPAFILCLLFTNLELRIMISVFQANSGHLDPRQVICKFNLISYGAILLMYPFMMYTNMGTSLFLIYSLLFMPQIYHNAVIGKRPNPNSSYYNQFLLFRFLIVLYLRCFPYNIFELRPNYLLGFGCLLIVGCQFGLLWVQKIYGPKKVLPKFLLPAVYNYEHSCEPSELSAVSSQVVHQQCAICLQLLKKSDIIPEIEYQGLPKIMKTPCGHKYHGYCLVKWMTLKMQCPQCRAKLPPYE